MKQISDFEIVDHGIDNSQYFQGYGTHGTNFSLCFTGCGESAKDAFEDCLDQIFQMDFDADKIRKSEEAKEYQTKKAADFTVSKYLIKQGHLIEQDWKEKEIESDLNDNYYYLSIRWNEKL